jgi:HSP20 family protein
MSIIRRNQFPAMSSFFDDFFTRDLSGWGLNNGSETNTTIPAVNIRETNDHFEVEMAAPGMNKEDFKVELDGNQLTISSEKKKEQEQTDEQQRYSRQEFSYESFQRTFTLPKDVVDADKIAAKYNNGVLYLTIPKKEEVKKRPPRMIQIS